MGGGGCWAGVGSLAVVVPGEGGIMVLEHAGIHRLGLRLRGRGCVVWFFVLGLAGAAWLQDLGEKADQNPKHGVVVTGWVSFEFMPYRLKLMVWECNWFGRHNERSS